MEGERRVSMSRVVKLAILAGVLGVAGPARAEIVTYTDEASFTAATTSLTNIDFEGIAPSGSFEGFEGGPLELSGVTFISNGGMFVIDAGYYGSSYPDGGFLTANYATNGVNTLVAALPTSVTALGIDLGGLFGPASFMVTLSDGSSFSASSLNSITGTDSLDFIGVTSTIPFSWIALDMPDGPDYNAIDNLRFGAAVPEPSTLSITLVGLALSGLIGGGMRRRNQRDDSEAP